MMAAAVFNRPTPLVAAVDPWTQGLDGMDMLVGLGRCLLLCLQSIWPACGLVFVLDPG